MNLSERGSNSQKEPPLLTDDYLQEMDYFLAEFDQEAQQKKLVRNKTIKQQLEWKATLIKKTMATGGKNKPEGVMDWFRLLRQIGDEELKHICGTDGALYIIFIRYAATFFSALALFNLVLFIPIYSSGSPSDPADV